MKGTGKEIVICSGQDSRDLYNSLQQKGKPSRKVVKGRGTNSFLKVVLSLFLFLSVILVIACTILMREPLRLFVDQMERITRDQYHTLLQTPFIIQPGLDLEKAGLLEYLENNGYRRTSQPQVDFKEYYLQGNVLFLGRGKENNCFRIELLNGSVVSIFDVAEGRVLDKYVLPQEKITSFLSSIWERRQPLNYEEFPRELLHGVISTEDRQFFSHFGIDFTGIVRAGVVNIRKGRVTQGGSTITQQLVKILLKRRERSWSRKIEEILVAIAGETLYSKEEILSAYLNNVYLGQAGRFEIRGMAMAANLIIGKNLSNCNINEYALLAGLIRSPNSASPVRNPLAAASRTRTVLKQMDAIDNYSVSKTIVENYHRSFTPMLRVKSASYYFDRLEQELKSQRLMPGPNSPPLQIELAFDGVLQEGIAQLMEEHLEAIERKRGLKRGTMQGAVVVMNVADGSVRAVVGGRDYQKSPFNRAYHARRQIGSLIKPFTYLVGLGGTGFKAELTQASMVSDTRVRVDFDRTSWTPRNYDGKYLGRITIRDAIAKSRNIPAIRIGLQSGLDRVADLVENLSINPEPDRRPSLLLGAVESTPAAMAGAYAAIANGGSKVFPAMVSRVVANNMIIWQSPRPKPLLSPAGCYVMTDILRSVFTNGSARRASAFAGSRDVAGKTGTTSKMRDAWFAGYSAEVVIVVWVGYDDNKPVGLTGSSGALPLWRKCMEKYQDRVAKKDFPVPPGIRFVRINRKTGQQVVNGEQYGETMAFIEGTEPKTRLVSLNAPGGYKIPVKL